MANCRATIPNANPLGLQAVLYLQVKEKVGQQKTGSSLKRKKRGEDAGVQLKQENVLKVPSPVALLQKKPFIA